ncbi:MAG: winged helix-turn-helix transcriptional regulator [Proteobacteria bacterium]|nr:winged helix-turn-helix transcriptional regulator [Pseudomonadota bacterium]
MKVRERITARKKAPPRSGGRKSPAKKAAGGAGGRKSPARSQAAGRAGRRTSAAGRIETGSANSRKPTAKIAERRKSAAVEADGRLVLEDFLPYRLSVLTNRISHAIARQYGVRFGLSIAEWRVMAVLGRFAPASANEVSERTAMDKVRVSRAVARLKRSGLIVAATDRADRRRSALRLSAPGKRIYRRIVPLALGLEAELIGALSPAERATLDGLLAKLHARAEVLDRG